MAPGALFMLLGGLCVLYVLAAPFGTKEEVPHGEEMLAPQEQSPQEGREHTPHG